MTSFASFSTEELPLLTTEKGESRPSSLKDPEGEISAFCRVLSPLCLLKRWFLIERMTMNGLLASAPQTNIGGSSPTVPQSQACPDLPPPYPNEPRPRQFSSFFFQPYMVDFQREKRAALSPGFKRREHIFREVSAFPLSDRIRVRLEGPFAHRGHDSGT